MRANGKPGPAAADKIPTETDPPAAFRGPTVTVTIPVLRTHPHPTQRIDMHLSRQGARALRDVLDGLMREDARLDAGNGTHVDSGADAVRWIMEQIADRIEDLRELECADAGA